MAEKTLSSMVFLCFSGQTEELKKYIQNGNNVNIPTTNGVNLLMLCAKNDKYDILKVLIDSRQFDVNATCRDGKTALIYACESKNVECIKKILDTPEIDIFKADKKGCLALDYILCSGNQHSAEILSLFIEKIQLKLDEQKLNEELNKYVNKIKSSAPSHTKIAQLAVIAGQTDYILPENIVSEKEIELLVQETHTWSLKKLNNNLSNHLVEKTKTSKMKI